MIRINDLARELGVKSKRILDVLPQVGVTRKRTHSSSLEDHEADLVRAHIRKNRQETSFSPRTRPQVETPNINLPHISMSGEHAQHEIKVPVVPAPARAVAASMRIINEKYALIHFDAILRKPTLFRFQTLLKYKDLKDEGLIEIEVYPPRRPQVEEISAADLERILKTIPMNSEQRRDVLAVRSLDSRSIKKAYLRAICLFFKSLEDDEKQLAFIIDGKQSQEHELAFAANEGFRRSLANLRSNDEKAEVRALTEGVEDTTTPQQLTAESDKLQTEASVAQVEGALESAPDDEKQALREKLQELEQQLSKAKEEADRFEVKNLYVTDHPPLLDDAISTAKSRLMIISPWVAGKVVTRAFTNKLESLLRKGVLVYIGYGISEDETQNLIPSDVAARKKLRDLDQMFSNFTFKRLGNTHAKVLIKDSEFAAITSFNWLSFKGDPSRTFRDEQGTLLRKPDSVNKKFDELVARFDVPPHSATE